MIKLKIKKIITGTKRHVYDLNVPKNHNFFILEKGILTHNCDNLTPATQAGLRSFIEDYSVNCGFIFTCNYKLKLIEPLRSRFSIIDFSIEKSERPKIAAQFYKRILQILNSESIEYDQKIVAKLIEKHFPDFRSILGDLQKYSASGKIDEGIFVNINQESINFLFSLLKDKKFTEMRKWVADNSDQDPNTLFRQLYDISTDKIEMSSLPGFIVTLSEYMYKHAFVSDPEINLAAFLTEIMIECKFK